MNSHDEKVALTSQQSEFTAEGKSAFSLYRELVVGDGSFVDLVGYELYQFLLANLPGLVGVGLRSLALPSLLQSCGQRPAFGRGVVLRNLKRMTLGNRVLCDDYATLDVRGAKASIDIDDCVSIGRHSSVIAKDGQVTLGKGVNIGTHCRIATQSKISIGESTLIAAYCYIGPGNHQAADNETPMISQPMDIRGGVSIGSHCWIGARSTILDGVSIGDGAIVGAHSLVREDVPPGATVVGVPARVVR